MNGSAQNEDGGAQFSARLSDMELGRLARAVIDELAEAIVCKFAFKRTAGG